MVPVTGVSNEINPEVEGVFWDEMLPSYVGIEVNSYKRIQDSYQWSETWFP